MPHELPSLPYARDALEPVMSAQTLAHHHGQHHRKYVETLNELIAGTEFDSLALEEAIKRTADDSAERMIFNNAAQAWNHAFFWQCLKPRGGGAPKGALARRIEADLGGYEAFARDFRAQAVGHFASGWAWLVAEAGKLKVVTTHDAGNPMVQGRQPLLCCDLWEHAYYLDHQHRRADFVAAFLDRLVNWDFVAAQLAARDRYEAAHRSAGDDVHAQAASARRALEGPESDSLHPAEQVGRSHAAVEDSLPKRRARQR
jgi:Fe-Mn family superoxide dismutase